MHPGADRDPAYNFSCPNIYRDELSRAYRDIRLPFGKAQVMGRPPKTNPRNVLPAPGVNHNQASALGFRDPCLTSVWRKRQVFVRRGLADLKLGNLPGAIQRQR